MADNSGIILMVVGGVAFYFMLTTCTLQNMLAQGGESMKPILDMLNQMGTAVGATCTGTATTTPTPPPGGAPAPGTAPASCDCSCMPMDGDPERRKIETAAGEDCVNHEYFGPADADALCAAKLAEVCATRGGGTTTPTGGEGPQYGGPGSVDEGDDSELGGPGSDEEENDDESNYTRASYDYYLRSHMIDKISPPPPVTLYPIDAFNYSV